VDLKKTEEKTINTLQGVGEGFLVMVIPVLSIFIVVGLSRRIMSFTMKKAAGE